jgi:2'-hydroxyisoflavone reductase
MDVLLIGGPQFVGRGVIDAALAGGHRITLFNRGRTHPELYPQVEKLRGDRDGGLAALDGRRWDAVIDTCGYVPRVVCQSAQRLRDCADAYLFISSISVYADLVGAREDSPRHVLEDRTVEDVTGATYGGLKALCEDEVVEAFGTRAVIVRPGMIVGAHDGTYRFPWWVGRVAAGGEVLYPAQGRIQLIDARDLGRFCLRLLEGGQRGAYNVTGPAQPLGFAQVLETMRRVAGAEAEFIGAADAFLEAQQVASWTEFPFWMPGVDWASVAIDKALDAGLTFRPLADTVRDTLAWLRGHPAPQMPPGISREREVALIAALRGQAGGAVA